MFRAGHAIAIAAIALLMIGVIMVNSAAMSVGRDEPLTISNMLLGRTMLLACLAVIALAVGAWINVDRLNGNTETGNGISGAHVNRPAQRAISFHHRVSLLLRWPGTWIVIGCILLLLSVYVPGLSRQVNNARRWIELGPILSFQPSEVAKWGLIIVIAGYAALHVQRMGTFIRGFAGPMLVIGLICGLIAIEDLGTAVLIGTVALCMLLAAGVRLWHLALLAPAACLAIAAALIHSPYRMNRLKAFADPYADPQGIGYHMIQSMAAVSAGGLPGRGLGNGIQKFGYVPEDTTDFIFAIICEELGMVGAIVIIACYAALLLGIMHVLLQTQRPFARLIALGVLLTIGIQAIINIFVVTGIGPTKGIALPLISSGGTGWVMIAFMLGLIVSIDRANQKQPAADSRSLNPEHDSEEENLPLSVSPTAWA